MKKVVWLWMLLIMMAGSLWAQDEYHIKNFGRHVVPHASYRLTALFGWARRMAFTRSMGTTCMDTRFQTKMVLAVTSVM